jgi:hypothetical protein
MARSPHPRRLRVWSACVVIHPDVGPKGRGGLGKIDVGTTSGGVAVIHPARKYPVVGVRHWGRRQGRQDRQSSGLVINDALWQRRHSPIAIQQIVAIDPGKVCLVRDHTGGVALIRGLVDKGTVRPRRLTVGTCTIDIGSRRPGPSRIGPAGSFVICVSVQATPSVELASQMSLLPARVSSYATYNVSGAPRWMPMAGEVCSLELCGSPASTLTGADQVVPFVEEETNISQ